MSKKLKMKHTFINKGSRETLVLFHGTGGDENDLVFLGEHINPDANILGLRGRINENGLNRFFKRLSPGVFDIDSLIHETKFIANDLNMFFKEQGLSHEDTILIGFSNGANLIGSHLYHFGNIYKGYVLMHPMDPIKDFEIAEQNQNKVLITAGNNDPLVTMDETHALKKRLEEKNADVTLKVYAYGHRITEKEIIDIKKWVDNLD